MKLAIVTDDKKSISQHFGRANYCAVLTVENGQIIHREIREKISHKHFAGELHEHSGGSDQKHGFDPVSQSRHGQMFQAITDCETLICRGMGTGAYESMREYGIRPIITDIETIDDAALAYADNSIVDHVERLH